MKFVSVLYLLFCTSTLSRTCASMPKDLDMKKNADDSGATDDSSGSFRWGSFFRHLTSFAVLLLIAGLIVGIAIGVRPLEEIAARVSGAKHPKVEIAWPARQGGGTWLPPQFQEELLTVVRTTLGATPTPFSAEPLKRVGMALEASGWFDGMPTVERKGPGLIVVSGTWRTPAAVVRSEGKDFLVSWKGHRMPPVYEIGKSGLPVIKSPVMRAPMMSDLSPDYAEAWPGEDIAASLELLREVASKPWAAQVSGVDAARYSAESTLALLTTFNTRIEWGGRFSKPRLGEAPTNEKLNRLAFLFRDRGRIDAGYPVVELWQRHLLFDRSAAASAAGAGAGLPKTEVGRPANGTTDGNGRGEGSGSGGRVESLQRRVPVSATGGSPMIPANATGVGKAESARMPAAKDQRTKAEAKATSKPNSKAPVQKVLNRLEKDRT